MPLYTADTVFACASCQEPAYRIKNDVYPFSPVRAEDFEPASPDIAPPLNGSIIACPFCGFNGADQFGGFEKVFKPIEA